MKIEFNEYTKVFENIIGQKEIKKLVNFVNENLLCMKCKIFKLDIEFSKGKPFKNRRERFPVCRICQKDYYIKKKISDFEASKK